MIVVIYSKLMMASFQDTIKRLHKFQNAARLNFHHCDKFRKGVNKEILVEI